MWPQLVLYDLKTIKMVSTFVKHWEKKKKRFVIRENKKFRLSCL